MIPGSYANGFAPRDGEPQYPQLWQGCVGAWAPCLGPTGSTLRDWSGRANHGTLTTMDPGTDWLASEGRYALDFDGTNDHVSIGDITLFNLTDNFTLSAWAKSTLNGQYQGIISKASIGDNYSGYLLEKMGGAFNKFSFTTLQIGASAVYTSSSSAYTDSNWHHVVGVRLNGTNYLFVDGVQQSTTTSQEPRTNSQPVLIGKYFGDFNDFYLQGSIDDVRIYNRPLNAFEVQLLYTLGRGGAYRMRKRPRAGVFVGRIPGGATMTGGMYQTQCGGMVG